MKDYLTHLLTARVDHPWPDALDDGTRVVVHGEGLIAFEPASAAFDLLISCGIHGNETAPVELAARLVQAVLDGDLCARARVLFVFGNPPALRADERYLDDDLNRLFGKSPASIGDGPAARRARELEAATRAFFDASAGRWKLHYDLHTAIRGSKIEKFAIYPHFADGEVDDTELARLAVAGIEAVLIQSAPSPTFSWFTRHHCGAHGFTLELGKARPFGHNQAVNLDRLDAELRRLIGGSARDYRGKVPPPQAFRVAGEVIKRSESFVLHLDDDVENFTELPLGYLLAENETERYVVEQAEARIVFPNAGVKPGLRAGIVVVPWDAGLHRG